MIKTTLLQALLVVLLAFSPLAQAYSLTAHSWVLNDASRLNISNDQLIKGLRTKWDKEASPVDLAHLYSFQLHQKFKLNSAKVFLFSADSTTPVATVINDANHLMALDHQDKSFIHLQDWILKHAQSYCTELIHPNDQLILLMQINRFKPAAGQCYYMLVPAHVYQQLELYPTSTPKDFQFGDIVEACYQSTDRKLFKKDRKSCESWVKKL